LYGGGAFWGFAVIRSSSPVWSRAAIVVLAAATLALAGCGRKGPLDLPPTASAQQQSEAARADAAQATPGSVFDPSFGANKPPATPKGENKGFVLDPLLND
jgi:predicted small lipoprotein YifL